MGERVPVQAFWACDRKQLMPGDSCTLTLVLLSSYDFKAVQIKRLPRIKGGKMRRLPVTPYVNRVHQAQSRDNRIATLNQLVYASFRATAEAVGKLQVKPLKIQVMLERHESFLCTSEKKQRKSIKKDVTIKKWELPVIRKPRKKTAELMHNRGFL